MTHLLTFTASTHDISTSHMSAAEHFLNKFNLTIAGNTKWLSENRALQYEINQAPSKAELDEMRVHFAIDEIDILIVAKDRARKKLLIADMDSTIVTGETLDEMASAAGLQEQIAAITTRAMNGELDFSAALTQRVKMLAGQSESILSSHLPHMQLSSGAKEFIKTMSANGATCVLVSGGFTFFTGYIAKEVGFNHHHGNVLEIDNGLLTGKVIPPILDKDAKYEFLKLYIEELGLDIEDTLTIGDGANDLVMLEAAGLGIGYHPKQLLKDRLDNLIVFGDLTAALYAQGYSDKDIING